MNPAHLIDFSFHEKSIGGFSGDGRVDSCNTLARDTFDPGRLVAFPDNDNVILTSANLPITVLTVS